MVGGPWFGGSARRFVVAVSVMAALTVGTGAQAGKAAGAAGRAGDIKANDSGWKVWVLSRGRGAARSEDRTCAATPRNGTYDVRARLQSAKAGQPGLVTSAWVSSVSARLSC